MASDVMRVRLHLRETRLLAVASDRWVSPQIVETSSMRRRYVGSGVGDDLDRDIAAGMRWRERLRHGRRPRETAQPGQRCRGEQFLDVRRYRLHRRRVHYHRRLSRPVEPLRAPPIARREGAGLCHRRQVGVLEPHSAHCGSPTPHYWDRARRSVAGPAILGPWKLPRKS